MQSTSIEWATMSWNPVRGCSRVSEGCRHCYAETMAARFSGPGQYAEGFAERTKAGGRWTGRVELIPH
jgi:protein gp37